MNLNNLVDRTFKDKNGHITIAQSPNLALFSFAVFTILAMLLRKGYMGYLTKSLAFGSIFVWSWLEIFSGSNYFRRILGAVVMVLSLISMVDYLLYLKT